MKAHLYLFLQSILIIILYIIGSKIGFFLAFLNSQVSPVWPPEGIALTAIVLLGWRAVPGILMGAFLANFLNNPHLPTAILIGIGNTLSVTINYYLMQRLLHSKDILESMSNLIRFILFCTLPGSIVSAFIGVTSLLIYNFVPADVYWNVLITWGSGEMQGFIIVAPFLITWSKFPKVRFNFMHVFEVTMFCLLIIISTLFAFKEEMPLAYLPFPFIIWASLRFNKYGATVAILFLSGIAVYRTISGSGPFAVFLNGKISLNNSLILLDLYIAAATVIAYVLVTVMYERTQAQLSLVEHLTTIERMKDLANHELENKVTERTIIIEKQKQELEKQIEMAGKIQDSLLPASIPTIDKLKIAIKYQPMMKLGGDFFDLQYNKSKNDFGFFLCDVSGHGVPAALLAAMVKMSLTYWYDHLHKLTESFNFIYEAIYDKLGKNFITASLIHINLRNGKLRTARAGHFPVMIITQTGKVIRLNSTGKIIMALKKPDAEEVEYRLNPGDRIVVYTDGIIEAHTKESYNLFSEERMIQMLLDGKDIAIDTLVENIFQSVVNFSGGLKHLDDDLTFVIMEYTPDK